MKKITKTTFTLLALTAASVINVTDVHARANDGDKTSIQTGWGGGACVCRTEPNANGIT